MVPPQRRIRFRWILPRQQVVRHRDYWKKDHQQNCQRHELSLPLPSHSRRKPEPRTQHRRCQNSPREIEDQLHSQS